MTLPSLTLLETFSAVARNGSFVAAARQLGVSASAVGKAVQRLEDEIGAALFLRSTRRVELTDEGKALLARLGPALEALAESIETVREQSGRIEGHLRITVPLVGYHLVNRALQGFLEIHPGVTVELLYSDDMVDLLAEGVDLAIRNGPLRDSSLIMRRFGPFRHGLFAAPDYLSSHGTPELDTLDAHARIAFRFGTTGRLQPWIGPGARALTLSHPRIVVNAIEGARTAAISGLGVAWLPDFILREDLASGRLVQVLAGSVREEGEFFLVRPAARAEPRRVRALVDHLAGFGPA